MKKALIVLLILILSVTLVACGGTEDADKETEKNNEEEVEEVDFEDLDLSEVEFESIISEEETPFTRVIDGEEVYLDEQSPEVIMLQMRVNEYNNLAETIDYKTVTGEEIYPITTSRLEEEEKKDNMPQKFIDFYTEHKIQQEPMGIEKYNYIKFEGDTAEVDVVRQFIYNNVEDLHNYETGEVLHRPEKLIFKNIDGEWFLDELIEARQIYSYED